MRDVGPEVLPDYDVPGRVVLLVELLLYVRRDVLLDVEALHGLDGAVYRVLLHVLGHVCILDVNAALAHFCFYDFLLTCPHRFVQIPLF
eukprot:XP_001706427.1 Hypothetical protein GL50803_9849 [Giardia lamblia ATCC 50803]